MHVAIVGAGMAGLAAGRRLAGQGHEVVVYEQSRDLGGRASTRRVYGCVLDDGAQYVKTPDDAPAVRRLLLEELPREGLIDISRPVWVFDRAGRVAPGDPAQNAEPKWTYAAGLETLAKRLAHGLAVRRETRVARLQRHGAGYRLWDAAGRELDQAARVLLAIPAAQAGELLRASEVAPARRDAALAQLSTVSYRALLSIALGYAQPPLGTIYAGGTAREPRPYYALVNTDRGHDVSWLAFENDKGPARVPPGTLALIAQMGAAFSAARFDEPAERLAAGAAVAVSALLAVDLRHPAWHDVTRWRYALPDATCSLAALNQDHQGLFCAGDYVAGGRVHLAIQAGLDVAALMERD